MLHGGGTLLDRNHLQKATQHPKRRGSGGVCSHPPENGGRAVPGGKCTGGSGPRVDEQQRRKPTELSSVGQLVPWHYHRPQSSRDLQFAVSGACQMKLGTGAPQSQLCSQRANGAGGSRERWRVCAVTGEWEGAG